MFFDVLFELVSTSTYKKVPHLLAKASLTSIVGLALSQRSHEAS